MKHSIQPENFSRVQSLIGCLDLTYLGEDDERAVDTLCDKAITPWGTVAGLCVYPQWLKKVSTVQGVQPVTVVNFPGGGQSLAEIEKDLVQALVWGAQEIDVVIPYQSYVDGSSKKACELLTLCRQLCAEPILLKVIIESGAMPNDEHIRWACRDAIQCGADFIKTSTGKVAVGATLSAVRIILEEIAAHQVAVGVKVSGGVRELDDALAYLNLAEQYKGDLLINSHTFRIGASQLLDNICQYLAKVAA